MFSLLNTNSDKFFSYSRLLLAACFLVLSACSGQEEAPDTDIQRNDNLSLQLPDALLGARVDRNNLSGTVTVGGNTYDMTIDDATDSASVSLSNIPTGSQTFVVEFFYDFGGTIIKVAEATRTITIGEGSNTVSFLATDFDTATFDDDGDGISNITELDESSTTSPIVTTCVVGETNIGECELGS